MKICTNIEQSKKLAEFLPIESADMCWQKIYDENHLLSDYRIELLPFRLYSGLGVPAWSLAALLDVLPSATLDSSSDHYYRLHCMTKYTEWYDNPVDACYEMIIKLHEQNLL
jgi:hypothetical protein